jgi:uncharacterized protein (DUF2141 family)
MRLFTCSAIVLSLLLCVCPRASLAADRTVKLTVYVEGVNKTGGTIGVYVFKNEKGWPESKEAAVGRVVVPAHPGTVIVDVPDLPPGDYAVGVGHDSNGNHRIDKNWLGVPTEQWGMSNNPRAVLKVPAFSRARFSLTQNADIHIQLH